MAVRRARPATSAAVIWLVVFAFLFVISLAVAITFYVQRTNQVQELTEAQQNLQQFVTSPERSSEQVDAIQARAQQSGRSVVGQLLLDVANLKRMLIGASEATIGQVQQQLTQAGVPEDRSALDFLTELAALLNQSQTAIQQLNDQVRQQQATLAALERDYETLRQDRNQKVQQLTQRVDELQQLQNSYEQRVGTQQQELSGRLDQVREDAEQAIRQRDERIKQLQDELANRDQRITELRDIIGGDQPSPPDETARADGRIITVDTEQDLVYIDLGHRNHLVLGMTFEVFDPSRGVITDNAGQLRGKASIEVVDIAENSAACRIIRSTFGRPVVENDLIANLVYDPDRSFKFYVFGNFDLDGDGLYTAADHDMIASLIRQWGGRVVDPAQRQAILADTLGEDAARQNLLPLDTDFVVIGQEPQLPRPLAPGERDPVRIRENTEARQRWERYNQITEQALTLGIPILNQNRFLALIGQPAP